MRSPAPFAMRIKSRDRRNFPRTRRRIISLVRRRRFQPLVVPAKLVRNENSRARWLAAVVVAGLPVEHARLAFSVSSRGTRSSATFRHSKARNVRALTSAYLFRSLFPGVYSAGRAGLYVTRHLERLLFYTKRTRIIDRRKCQHQRPLTNRTFRRSAPGSRPGNAGRIITSLTMLGVRDF